MRTMLVCSAIALVVAACPLAAQESPTSGTSGLAASSTSATSSSSVLAPAGSEARFVRMASAGGMAEVQLGQLASSKGQSAQVRQFGQRMVTDHTQANQELSAIARKKGIPVATQPTPEAQAEMQRLQSINRADFDEAYAQAMVNDHEEDLALFSQEARIGSDADLQAYANKTVPVLKRHLSMAKALPGSGTPAGTP